ncbi:MAG: hypothetical protein Rsou_1037 [Candidatus Ruthia sp. Asou_11_S2]|nr:hypothetical protein [Candidatus Ruthia sp. Asou_11_S2]
MIHGNICEYNRTGINFLALFGGFGCQINNQINCISIK